MHNDENYEDRDSIVDLDTDSIPRRRRRKDTGVDVRTNVTQEKAVIAGWNGACDGGCAHIIPNITRGSGGTL